MIPLRDTIPSRTFPAINYLLMAANLACFLYELSLGSRLDGLLSTWGLVPARLFSLGAGPGRDMLTLATSMFLHAGWLHFLGNMLYLYIFGDNVEDRLGHLRYLVFYLLCGICAGLAQALVSPTMRVPMVGASGAIAGVMGAYFCLYPRARVVTLLFLFVFVQVVEIPAFFFLGLWFLLQFFSGAASLDARTAAGGVAWWAHIGGFASGVVLLFFLKRRRARRRLRII